MQPENLQRFHDDLKAAAAAGVPLEIGMVGSKPDRLTAVGMCKQDKNKSKPLDRQPTVSLERVLKEVSKGVVHPDLASTLGAKISRLAGNRSDIWHATGYRDGYFGYSNGTKNLD